MAREAPVTIGYIDRHRHAVIPVDLFDHRSRLRRVQAMVDTGFDDFLALPAGVIQSLGLSHVGRVSMQVATAQSEDFDAYAASVWWFGNRRSFRVLQSPDEIIAGTRLLRDTRLTLELWDGGSVTLENSGK